MPQRDIERTVTTEERRGLSGVISKKGEKRKSQFRIGTQVIGENLVLGMEVSIDESLAVAECTIVGRARGRKFSPEDLQKWGAEQFIKEIPLSFEAQCLVKGWFMLKFADKEAADWVLEKNWCIGSIHVLMKRWSPLFDAIKENTDVFPVWVRAPGLPFFLWTEAVFKSIGNRLGTFMEADLSFMESKVRASARILTNIDTSKGLAKEITLQYRDYIYVQVLDYEHLPFRCHICHEYGHLAKRCSLIRRQRRFRKTNDQRAHRRTQPRTNQELRVSPPPSEAGMDPEDQVVGDQKGEAQNSKEAVVEDPSPEDAEMAKDRNPSPVPSPPRAEDEGNIIQQQTSFLNLAYNKIWGIGL